MKDQIKKKKTKRNTSTSRGAPRRSSNSECLQVCFSRYFGDVTPRSLRSQYAAVFTYTTSTSNSPQFSTSITEGLFQAGGGAGGTGFQVAPIHLNLYTSPDIASQEAQVSPIANQSPPPPPFRTDRRRPRRYLATISYRPGSKLNRNTISPTPSRSSCPSRSSSPSPSLPHSLPPSTQRFRPVSRTKTTQLSSNRLIEGIVPSSTNLIKRIHQSLHAIANDNRSRTNVNMEAFGDIPILLDGRSVGQVTIKRDHKSAIALAMAAASHVSTPDDIQFCSFSDASSSHKDYRGGVGLAYKWRWLPQEWVAGRAATDPTGDMVEKAWPYGYAIGTLVVEGVGILESLYAANEELKRHLPLLAKHASTVKVKVTTDCLPILRHICRTTTTGEETKKRLPPQLIKEIKDLILKLQTHGIKVIVELHWCPRNMVPQLSKADKLAGQARRSGMGYCTATGNFWSQALESAIIKQLAPKLVRAVSFARVPAIHDPTDVPSADGTEKKKCRRKKRWQIKAAQTMTTDAATSQPQSSPPAASLPLESTKLASTTPPDAQPCGAWAEAKAGKREAEEEMEESEGRPKKKARRTTVTTAGETSPTSRAGPEHQRTLPAACLETENIESVVKEEVTSQETIPEETVPQEAVPQEAVPEEDVQNAVTPEEPIL